MFLHEVIDQLLFIVLRYESAHFLH